MAADAVLRPTWDGEAGWPVLIPASLLARLRAIEADRMPPEVLDDLIAAGSTERLVDLGDPGVVIDGGTSRADLPAYVGPIDPPAGHVHEWGSQAADASDDSPLEGPALAPYGPAGEADD